MPDTVTTVNATVVPSDFSGETEDRAMLANALKTEAANPIGMGRPVGATIGSTVGRPVGMGVGVTAAKPVGMGVGATAAKSVGMGVGATAAKSSGQYGNVTNKAGGYGSAVTGSRKAPGSVKGDVNGDGVKDWKDAAAFWAGLPGTIWGSPFTWIVVSLALGTVVMGLNIEAWRRTAYAEGQLEYIAVIFCLGFTAIEVHPILSTVHQRASLSQLIVAARSPDKMVELKKKFVKNADQLMEDQLKRNKKLSSMQQMYVTALICGIEWGIVSSGTNYIGPNGLRFIPLLFTAAIVGGAVGCAHLYKNSVNALLSKVERSTLDEIESTLDNHKVMNIG